MAARNFGLRLYNRCYTTKASTDATATIAKKFENNVVPSYGRYNIALTHGKGPYIWDASGKKYLDAAGGIAVNCLGHAHPEIVETVSKQAAKIMHCSNPLGCAVALKVLEIIKRDKLEQNVRELGDYFKAQLKRMHDEHPDVVSTVRGEGFMLGLELSKNIPAFAAHKDKPQSSQFVDLAHHEGLLLVTSGSDVLRILPPFNWSKHEVDECLGIINRIVTKLSAHAK
eukprot:Colp12_sorted_trinity150504_noHs@32530